MKTKIVCLVGDSGSGKTHASFYLHKTFGWNTITSYTTRPMRKGEVNGKEHIFVTTSSVPARDKMFAYTFFGGHQYWTRWSQFKRNKINVYIIDEKGLKDLVSQEHRPFDFDIVAVKIKRPDKSGIDKERIERDKERITIPDEKYDYIVVNDDSIEMFETKLYLVGGCITMK